MIIQKDHEGWARRRFSYSTLNLTIGIKPREVLHAFRPIADDLHISSQAVLALVSAMVATFMIAGLLGVRVLYKRRRKPQSSTKTYHISAPLPATPKPNSVPSFPLISPILPHPDEILAPRPERSNWAGKSREPRILPHFNAQDPRIQPFKYKLSRETTTNSPPWPSPDDNVQYHPSSSSRREISYSSKRSLVTRRLKLEVPEAVARHASSLSPVGCRIHDSQSEDFLSYYNDGAHDSLASYYRSSAVGQDANGLLLPPPQINPERKTDSTFSIGGLVDMYVGSPTMGMGSPSSPFGRASRLPLILSRGLLSPSGESKRLVGKQPSISHTRDAPFTRYRPPDSDEDEWDPSPTHSSASNDHDRRNNSNHLISLQPYPPSSPALYNVPDGPPKRQAPTIIIPPVPPKVPTSGSILPVRRRLRGGSLYGEIMRMTA